MPVDARTSLRDIYERMQSPCPYPGESSAAEQSSWIELDALEGRLSGHISDVLGGGRVQVALVRDVQRGLREHPEYAAGWRARYDLLWDACIHLDSIAGNRSGNWDASGRPTLDV